MTALHLCYMMHTNATSAEDTERLYRKVYGDKTSGTLSLMPSGPCSRLRRFKLDPTEPHLHAMYDGVSPKELRLQQIKQVVMETTAFWVEELWRKFNGREASGCRFNDTLTTIQLPRACLTIRSNPTVYTLSPSTTAAVAAAPDMVIRRVSDRFIDILKRLYVLKIFDEHIMDNKCVKKKPFSYSSRFNSTMT